MIKQLAFATALTVTGASLALAVPHGPQRGQGGHKRSGMMAGRMAAGHLDLSEAQKSQIRNLVERNRSQTSELRERLQSQAMEYRRLKAAKDSRAESVRNELLRTKDELFINRTALRTEIQQIFTPEQRQKLEELRENRQKRGEGQMRQRRGEGQMRQRRGEGRGRQ